MMDITDTATAAARTATDDLTLAGYTRAIEQGRHPTWGPQQTSQLDSATPVKQQAGTPLAAQSRPRTGLANMQAWSAPVCWLAEQLASWLCLPTCQNLGKAANLLALRLTRVFSTGHASTP